MFESTLRDDGQYDVTFSLPWEIRALVIHLLIDWDKWDRNAHPMRRKRQDDGRWTVTLSLPPGRHCYFYMVDRERMTDMSPDGHAHDDVLDLDCALLILPIPNLSSA